MTPFTLHPPANTSYRNHTITGTEIGIWPEESNRSVRKRERVCNLRQMGNSSWHGSQSQASLLQARDSLTILACMCPVGLPGMLLKGLCMGG